MLCIGEISRSPAKSVRGRVNNWGVKLSIKICIGRRCRENVSRECVARMC